MLNIKDGWWVIGVCAGIIILQIIGSWDNIFAHAELQMKMLPQNIWQKSPKVCLSQEHRYEEFMAMHGWKKVFPDLKYSLKDQSNCDIKIKFDSVIGDEILGRADCAKYSGVLSCTLHISEDRPIKLQSWRSITHTIMHEFGHSIGLGHLRYTTSQEWLNDYKLDALMGEIQYVTRTDVDNKTIAAANCIYDGTLSPPNKLCVIYP